MKTAVFASLIAGAAAFAPAQKGASSTALANAGKAAFGNEIGAQVPVSKHKSPCSCLITTFRVLCLSHDAHTLLTLFPNIESRYGNYQQHTLLIKF